MWEISGANIHLIRGENRLNPETLRKHSLSYNSAEHPPRVYIHNYSNIMCQRMGRTIGQMGWTADEEVDYDCDYGFSTKIENVLKKLRADPFKEVAVTNNRVVEAVGDIFTREFAEFEWKTTYGFDTLKINLPSILNAIPANKPIESYTVYLNHRIGRGRFGDVFFGTLHRDIVAVRKVRMRMLNLGTHKEGLTALMNLDHPNIVRFLCLEPDKFLIVMEYMEMSLDEALHVHKIQMRDDVKMDLMAQMWRGLDYLHKRNVAHCDIKSANVLLQNVKEGEKGITAKLTDYGLAIVQDPTDVNKLYVPDCFSVRYSAPEIFLSTPLNLSGLKAADVYSTAVICLELSTEKRPYFGYPNDSHYNEKLLRHRSTGSTAIDFSPSDCVWYRFGTFPCLEKCWSRPNNRPTAEEMVTEMENLISSGTNIFVPNIKNKVYRKNKKAITQGYSC